MGLISNNVLNYYARERRVNMADSETSIELIQVLMEEYDFPTQITMIKFILVNLIMDNIKNPIIGVDEFYRQLKRDVEINIEKEKDL